MKIESLETARLRIRQFDRGDLDNCRRFRREVFGLDESANRVKRWLTWTTDSYRELAQLGQPPYADYAVVLWDSDEFIGSAGIVPTLVPWGALKGDASDSVLSPEFGLYWGIFARASPARICDGSGTRPTGVPVPRVEGAAGRGDNRA